MQRVILTTDMVIVHKDDKTTEYIKIDDNSERYLEIKAETNNFTTNIDMPKTPFEILQETVDQLVLDSLGV